MAAFRGSSSAITPFLATSGLFLLPSPRFSQRRAVPYCRHPVLRNAATSTAAIAHAPLHAMRISLRALPVLPNNCVGRYFLLRGAEILRPLGPIAEILCRLAWEMPCLRRNRARWDDVSPNGRGFSAKEPLDEPAAHCACPAPRLGVWALSSTPGKRTRRSPIPGCDARTPQGAHVNSNILALPTPPAFPSRQGS